MKKLLLISLCFISHLFSVQEKEPVYERGAGWVTYLADGARGLVCAGGGVALIGLVATGGAAPAVGSMGLCLLTLAYSQLSHMKQVKAYPRPFVNGQCCKEVQKKTLSELVKSYGWNALHDRKILTLPQMREKLNEEIESMNFNQFVQVFSFREFVAQDFLTPYEAEELSKIYEQYNALKREGQGLEYEMESEFLNQLRSELVRRGYDIYRMNYQEITEAAFLVFEETDCHAILQKNFIEACQELRAPLEEIEKEFAVWKALVAADEGEVEALMGSGVDGGVS